MLVFPVVLALLGDNPMQSEFASHIGLRGRRFCRVCDVQAGKRRRRRKGDDDEDSDLGEDGDDDDDDDIPPLPPIEDDDDDPRPSSPALSVGSRAGTGHPRYEWTVPGIVDRLSAFIKVRDLSQVNVDY